MRRNPSVFRVSYPPRTEGIHCDSFARNTANRRNTANGIPRTEGIPRNTANGIPRTEGIPRNTANGIPRTDSFARNTLGFLRIPSVCEGIHWDSFAFPSHSRFPRKTCIPSHSLRNAKESQCIPFAFRRNTLGIPVEWILGFHFRTGIPVYSFGMLGFHWDSTGIPLSHSEGIHWDYTGIPLPRKTCIPWDSFAFRRNTLGFLRIPFAFRRNTRLPGKTCIPSFSQEDSKKTCIPSCIPSFSQEDVDSFAFPSHSRFPRKTLDPTRRLARQPLCSITALSACARAHSEFHHHTQLHAAYVLGLRLSLDAKRRGCALCIPAKLVVVSMHPHDHRNIRQQGAYDDHPNGTEERQAGRE